MANEAITWPAPPVDTDENDGTQCYNMGRVFTLTDDVPIVGVEWRVPDSVAAPQGGPHAVALWNQVSGVRLAYKEVTPTPGGPQQFLFDEGDIHPGLTSETLIASIYTNHYVYNTAEHIGATSPSGTIVAGDSLLIPFNGGAATAPIPDGSTTLNWYVSPIASLEEDHTTTGTAPVEVAADSAVTTTRSVVGTVPVAVTASATSTTGRVTSGDIPVAVTATGASTTTRTATRTAPVAATATALSTTARTTSGVAGVEATAGAYAAAGAAGPRLISAPQSRALVSSGGPDRIVAHVQVVR